MKLNEKDINKYYEIFNQMNILKEETKEQLELRKNKMFILNLIGFPFNIKFIIDKHYNVKSKDIDKLKGKIKQTKKIKFMKAYQDKLDFIKYTDTYLYNNDINQEKFYKSLSIIVYCFCNEYYDNFNYTYNFLVEYTKFENIKNIINMYLRLSDKEFNKKKEFKQYFV